MQHRTIRDRLHSGSRPEAHLLHGAASASCRTRNRFVGIPFGAAGLPGMAPDSKRSGRRQRKMSRHVERYCRASADQNIAIDLLRFREWDRWTRSRRLRR